MSKEKSYTKDNLYARIIRYVIIIVVLGIINLLFSPGHLWVLWVVGIGAISLIIAALRTFVLNDNSSD